MLLRKRENLEKNTNPHLQPNNKKTKFSLQDIYTYIEIEVKRDIFKPLHELLDVYWDW